MLTALANRIAEIRMPRVPTALLYSKKIGFLLGIFFAWAWGTFSYIHLLKFQASSDWSYLLFFVAETLAAVFFLVRSEPVTVSDDPVDWILAISATFAPFLMTPATWGIFPQAKLLVIAGSGLQIAGLISLNRSLALVPAKRELKTAGMYGLVRHPLYASYLLSYTGYALANTSLSNIFISAMGLGLLLFRLQREEKHLAQDVQYRAYMQRVKYRVIPLIY